MDLLSHQPLPEQVRTPPKPFASLARMHRSRFSLRIRKFVYLTLFTLLASNTSIDWANAENSEDFFEKEVRPLLVQHCHECHSSEAKELGGGLNLDNIKDLLRGGESGPAVDLKSPEDSLLIQAIRYTGDFYQMPPDAKLSDKTIATFEKWVLTGAAWPTISPDKGSTPFEITTEDRKFWAFQPISRPAVPSLPADYIAFNEIDHFIANKASNAGLHQAPPANRDSLIRRLSFGLTGLPPNEQQFFEYRELTASDVINQLLSSQRYGERWAQHWFDGVRYMSDLGYYNFSDKGWYYRDWVINSLNLDMGYDDFILHQIAGDLLPSPNPPKPYLHGRIATGVLAMGNFDDQDSDKERLYAEIIDDQIDMVGRQFLGLTLSCARCHDHKFDPISQRDYYALGGIFLSTKVVDDTSHIAARRLKQKADPALFAKAIEEETLAIAKQEELVRELLAHHPGSNEWRKAQDHLNSLRLSRTPQTDFIAAIDGAYQNSRHNAIGDMYLYRRGNPFNPGEKVTRGVPEILRTKDVVEFPIVASQSGRLELARWIASPDNPLTARVMVNRIWHYHFGKGIVASPSNFGFRGSRPSHPELLDFLASELIDHQWSLKHIHRLILNSYTYQQSSQVTPTDYQADPENKHLTRFESRRLSAEEIYDSLLLIAGTLKPGIGRVDSNRAIYRRIGNAHQWLEGSLFDAPAVGTITPQRDQSTVAPQALYMLNSAFVIDSAKKLANRAAEGKRDILERINYSYRTLFGRNTTDEECKVLVERFNELPNSQHWQIYQVLIASNEFLYLD